MVSGFSLNLVLGGSGTEERCDALDVADGYNWPIADHDVSGRNFVPTEVLQRLLNRAPPGVIIKGVAVGLSVGSGRLELLLLPLLNDRLKDLLNVSGRPVADVGALGHRDAPFSLGFLFLPS